MRAAALVAFLAVMAIVIVAYGGAAENRCVTGRAAGFVSIQHDPPFLVGTIPTRFTSQQIFFSRRYSCLGNPPEVRRVDLGFYDVRFPGMPQKVAISDAISDDAVSSAVQYLGDGIYRVSLRGPIVGEEVISRRDVSFSLVLY